MLGSYKSITFYEFEVFIINLSMLCETCKIEITIKFGSGRFCSKKCANKFSSNQNKDERILNISNAIKTKIANGERVGFAKLNSNNIVQNNCLICGRLYHTRKYGEKLQNKTCSMDCGVKLRVKTYHNNKNKIVGGYRIGSGRGKSGWYNGYWCDSSYELAFVIFNLEHNIPFERNTNYFEYVLDNEIHKYYPDFIVNGEYVEIKGYETDITKIKLASVTEPIKLLLKKDLSYMFDYVITKYGIDYIKLYDS